MKPVKTDKLVISAEPKMPHIEFEGAHNGPNDIEFLSSVGKLNTQEPIYKWHLKIDHLTVPNRIENHTKLVDIATNDLFYKPNFALLKDLDDNEVGGIMGGEMAVTIDYYGLPSDTKEYKIVGTNPGKNAIENYLIDSTPRLIACQESRYKQFDAKREGGTGMPNVGETEKNEKIGGIGIMQIYSKDTRPDFVWNWQENLKQGIKKYNDSLKDAKRAHIKERKYLKKDRKLLGLPACPEGVPTQLSENQIQEDAIRRYNCGREFRWEPRDAPNCEGKWVHDLSCKREKINGYDENYVEKVLSCGLDK